LVMWTYGADVHMFAPSPLASTLWARSQNSFAEGSDEELILPRDQIWKNFDWAGSHLHPPTFMSLYFLFLSNGVTYWFQTLQVTAILKLVCGKIVWNFFVKFKLFKYLKFNNFYFKKYIYNVIKNSKLFFPCSISNVILNCSVWDSKFLYYERYEKDKLFERGKKG
jgi:hypothetical protein